MKAVAPPADQRTAHAARLFAALIAIVAAAGLGLQFAASYAVNGALGTTIWSLLRYFTILSNLAVAMVFAGLASEVIAHGRATLLGGVTLSILLVGIVNAVLLWGLFNLSGIGLIADRLLHVATPVLVPLYWLAFRPRARLGPRDPWAWLAFPVAYFGYAVLRATVDGVFAYPFLNVGRLGWAGVLQIALVIAGAIVLAGYVMVWWDTRTRR